MKEKKKRKEEKQMQNHLKSKTKLQFALLLNHAKEHTYATGNDGLPEPISKPSGVKGIQQIASGECDVPEGSAPCGPCDIVVAASLRLLQLTVKSHAG